MYFFCDMGEEEIARIEGVSHQAVHDTLSSAVRLLREFVEGGIGIFLDNAYIYRYTIHITIVYLYYEETIWEQHIQQHKKLQLRNI